jgi:hypothetical protein
MRPIGGGYILEAATSLGTMGTWEPVVEESRVPPHDDNLQLVNVTTQVDGRATFYRLRRLWNPPTLNVYSLDCQHDRADPAERVAAHEPPPRALVSDAVGDRTPDSLPAPGSSGGR